MVKIGPNTNADPQVLSKKIILCCGEDAYELSNSLQNLVSRQHSKYHEYKCYKFWKFPQFTLIWTGIGTGCLEPLLWEVLKTRLIEEMIIIGTAGNLPNSKAEVGKIYVINEAYLAATALDENNISQPLKPSYETPAGYDTSTIVSTDFFYGFSHYVLNGNYPGDTKQLKTALNEHLNKRDMVDMEVGQFYYFCQQFNHNKKLKYVAIKGPSNAIGKFEEQTAYSSIIIQKSLETGLKLLQIDISREGFVKQKETAPKSSNKLVEEIKLYWSIQIATAGILGYLGSTISAINYKSFLICFVALLLVSIGAVYNFVGNYYIYVEGENLDFSEKQENLITPFLAKIYAVISAIIGSICFLSLFEVIRHFIDINYLILRVIFAAAGFVLGFAINWNITKSVFEQLYSKGTKAYKTYSKVSCKWFLMED